jgi:phage shock protein A
MGIFRRINDIISANLNDLVERFEDPEAMLRQAVREMDDVIATTSAAAARSIAAEKLLTKELDAQRERSAAWQRRAEAAVLAADDVLARQALVRRREHESLMRALEEQRASTQAANARLRRQIAAMYARRAEGGRKLATLAARRTAARARMHGGCGTSAVEAFARFDRLSERIELAEAEADALVELDHGGDEWLTRLDAEEDSRAIDAELAEMRKAVASGG